MDLAFMLLLVCFRAGCYAGVESADVFFAVEARGERFLALQTLCCCSGKAPGQYGSEWVWPRAGRTSRTGRALGLGPGAGIPQSSSGRATGTCTMVGGGFLKSLGLPLRINVRSPRGE